MAQRQLIGRGVYWPPIPPNVGLAPSMNGFGIGTSTSCAQGGRVWFPARTGSKNIQKIGFRFGGITKSGGSGIRISLEDPDLTAGPPMRPDGTQDQFIDIANGDAGFTSNAWYLTGNLSATRTVSFEDRLFVVLDWDGAGRQGSDTVTWQGLTTTYPFGLGDIVSNNAGWSVQSALANVLLVFDDGTFGTLEGSFVCSSAVNSVSFKQDSATDEYALAFTVPVPCYCDGAWFLTAIANGSADFDIRLYNGTTQIASSAVDANEHAGSGGAARIVPATWTEVALLPGNQYYLSVCPTQTAAGVTIYYCDVSAAGHWVADPGEDWSYSTRVNLGSWAPLTTTRRPFAGISVSRLDTGGVIIARRAGPVVSRVAGPNRRVFVISGGGGGITQNVIVTRPRRIM